MAILLNAQGITLSYGTRPLFEKISLSLHSGERVGLIGPNGAGKSTLMKIMSGKLNPDQGVVSFQKGLRVGVLEQVPQFQGDKSILETVMEGADDPDDWEEMGRAQEILSKFEIMDDANQNPETKISLLSGGWKKKVALARELMRRPDLLLLDEPTNHLDLESILWLEEFLKDAPFAVCTITHDRAFLQNVAQRIIDLDRRNPNGIFSVAGDYLTFLQAKEDLLNAQERKETRLRNTLRRETEWLRRGPKARTTKQQARIERAGDLQDTVAELGYRNKNQKVQLDFQGAEKNPRKLLEATGISKSYGPRQIFPKTDIFIHPKSRLGIVGKNGCGKSTLIRVLLKSENPDTGEVFHSDQLQPLIFEQNRESLDPNTTLFRTLCPAGDHVDFQGVQVHVRGYLERFLFTPPQMEMQVRNLSGGEQSRLLIAKLMLQKGNLLVLDEPTNDLDIETLDVLQDVLTDFQGAVILITHDRYFMDQVAQSILAFPEEAKPKELLRFTGMYQWQAWYEVDRETRARELKAASKKEREAQSQKHSVKKKLSFKDQLELDGMEANIRATEKKLQDLAQESGSPVVASNAKRLQEITKEMTQLQAEIDRLYARWAQLER